MRPLLPPRPHPRRGRELQRLLAETWDLVIVGGGATGTAAARDAALRGLKVALLEQDDLAAGTSSRSSRLIHGGLRYLARFELGLVREGLFERRLLLEALPGIVRPVRFLYPIWRGDPDPPWKVALGLGLYDLLALRDGLANHRRLARQRVLDLVPGLRAEGLRSGFLYPDAAAHDARLTLALAIAAREAGALVLTRCGATELIVASGRAVGLRIEDRFSGEEAALGARAVLFCCGPWAELLPEGLRLRRARGSHISLPARRLAVPCHLALRAPGDGRLAFALPAGEYTVIGTTDDDDLTPPAEVRPTAADTDYLLGVAAHAFPAQRLGRQDVVGGWAGLRPLLADPEARDPDTLSRRHAVVPGPPGAWFVTGGKLTTHRRMAAEAIDRVVSHLGLRRPCPTRAGAILSGSPARGADSLRRLGLRPAIVEGLAELYGARLERLAEILSGGGAVDEAACLRAQIRLAVDEEWALGLDDLFLRRLLPGPLDLRAGFAAAADGAALLGEQLGWTAEERSGHLAAFRAGLRSDLLAAGLAPPD